MRQDTDILDMRGSVLNYLQDLQETSSVHSPLLDLWGFSYVRSGVLVLPSETATAIAEAHPDGYHSGVWHLAIEYEHLVAKALLTNSNRNALGHGQPKSFSAWPRRHNVSLYREASRFRSTFRD